MMECARIHVGMKATSMLLVFVALTRAATVTTAEKATVTACEHIDEVFVSVARASGAGISATALTLPVAAIAAIDTVRLCDVACGDGCDDEWLGYIDAAYVPDIMRARNATGLVSWWPEGRAAWTYLVGVGRFVLGAPVYDDAVGALSFAVLDGPEVGGALEEAFDLVAELVPLPTAADRAMEDDSSAPDQEVEASCASSSIIVEAFMSSVNARLTNTTLSVQLEEGMNVTLASLCNVGCSDACALEARWQGMPLAVPYLLSASSSIAPADFAASWKASSDTAPATMSAALKDGSTVVYKLMLGEPSYDAAMQLMDFAVHVVAVDVLDGGSGARRRRKMLTGFSDDVPVECNVLSCFPPVIIMEGRLRTSSLPG